MHFLKPTKYKILGLLAIVFAEFLDVWVLLPIFARREWWEISFSLFIFNYIVRFALFYIVISFLVHLLTGNANRADRNAR